MVEQLNHQTELSLRPIEDSFHFIENKLLFKWPMEARPISFPVEAPSDRHLQDPESNRPHP